MHAVKVIIFLIIFSLSFQGLASRSFCDITADENSSATMDSGQHDCCNDDSSAKDQCQCNVAVASALAEDYILDLLDSMDSIPVAFSSKLSSSSTNNIFHPPRLF